VVCDAAFLPGQAGCLGDGLFVILVNAGFDEAFLAGRHDRSFVVILSVSANSWIKARSRILREAVVAITRAI